MTPILFGCDPGLANFGWSVVKLTEPKATVLSLGVICTEKSTQRATLLASEDAANRCIVISRFLNERFSQGVLSGNPEEWIHAVAAESMSWPRSAGAAAKVALAYGTLISNAGFVSLPLLQASPQYVKKALCGKRNASKEEVELAVLARANFTTAASEELASLPKGKCEHAFDSVAAALAVADYEVIKLLRRAA